MRRKRISSLREDVDSFLTADRAAKRQQDHKISGVGSQAAFGRVEPDVEQVRKSDRRQLLVRDRVIRLEGGLYLRIASVRDGSPVAGLQGLQKIRAKPVTMTKGRAQLFSWPADQVIWPTRSASSRHAVSEATKRNIGTAWRRSQSSNKEHVYGGLRSISIYL